MNYVPMQMMEAAWRNAWCWINENDNSDPQKLKEVDTGGP